MARRVIGVVVVVLILILLVLGVRGCFAARAERGFENYVRDVNSLVAESKQLSDGFFGRLDDPGDLTELNYEAEIRADRGTAEGLLTRAANLDAPDELAKAHDELVFAFELRRDGMGAIADQIGTALGDEGRKDATEAIAQQMRTFLASDVIYSRSQRNTNTILSKEDISDEVPNSQFLPSPPPDWLDPLTISSALAKVSGGEETTGVHGVGLVQVLALPSETVLAEDSTTTVSGDGSPEIEVQVENQGEEEETDVVVSVSISGGESPIEGEQSIPTIAPGETQSATIPLDPAPPTGTELTLEVTVEPVLGEQVEDNNTATYQLTYE